MMYPLASVLLGAAIIYPMRASAQSLVDLDLRVTNVTVGLNQPIAMAFIGLDDILVTERATGRVKRVKVTGSVVNVTTVLDIAVNSAQERGLLGITLHPNFPSNPGVYLYHTESSTGIDTTNVSQVPLLGNRVDRYVWNNSMLAFDRNIIKLRAFQNDINNINGSRVERGNHNGGVIRFGPDGKLYVVIGDNGRRGWMQNVLSGLINNTNGQVADDEFGGPAPDNAHLTGVILRLNDDGSTPHDNPFNVLGAKNVSAEVGENLQRVFAYGIRNSFGMTFDPKKGDLWITENGGRAFDEINRIERGFNGGWVQLMGPLHRIKDFKAIEIAANVSSIGAPAGLQQLRFPPEAIQDDFNRARQLMFDIPGAKLRDPEFSWKYVVPPSGLGFIHGTALGPKYDGDLIVGSAVSRTANRGNLYRFRLNGGRTEFVFNNTKLHDKVADNNRTDDFVTEGEEILFGTAFGVVTDIQTGPDGALYLVSPTFGSIRKIVLEIL